MVTAEGLLAREPLPYAQAETSPGDLGGRLATPPKKCWSIRL
jgi:hypothetical protein